ncbi:leucine-rich colipase-like protein 1 [Physeter macrocephalus]|uniref:Leucine-rich colipase-like protein 1 n=1 Tax=Physeter macrocephalus TaxID=9755 RepID=A0A455AIP3_PHYMC|nr:leucine-rich colipase-like protein 1 [Physeter catodon]|eukprot:XP_028336385.1 leucine-rich colipase-like protein 1 [Physeter catodon]
MARAGRLLLLWLLPATLVTTRGKQPPQSHKPARPGAAAGTGGRALTRQEHSECQSGCCVTNSLSPQKFCSPQTVFQQCLSWQKPNGYACLDHTECRSGCCVTSSYGLQTYCAAKTIFLQCVPWRKPNGDYCTDHSECRSKCCIRLHELGPHRCVPRSGILVQCLPWVSPGTGSSPPVGLTPATGLRAAGSDLEVVCPLPGEAANCLCRSASVPVS